MMPRDDKNNKVVLVYVGKIGFGICFVEGDADAWEGWEMVKKLYIMIYDFSL